MREEGAQRLGRNTVDGRLRSKDGTTERVVRPKALGEQLMHEVVGNVLDHLDFLDDHLLLAIDVVGVKCRAEEKVGN